VIKGISQASGSSFSDDYDIIAMNKVLVSIH